MKADDSKRPADPPPKMSPAEELDAAYYESVALKDKGEAEDVIAARLQSRLDDLKTRLDREMEEEIARIKATIPVRKIPPLRTRILGGILVVIVIAGALFDLTIGQRFVFAAADQSRAAAFWLVAVLAPLFAWFLILSDRANHILSARAPTGWVRRLILIPLMSLMFAGLMARAPVGWATLFGWMTHAPQSRLEARVLSIAQPSSRGCRQGAEILLGGNSSNICLSDVLVGRLPKAGEAVDVVGRVSGFGTYITELHTR